MAIRHIQEYYEKVCDQYFTSLNNIKKLEEEVMNGLTDPEYLERVKKNILPIKDNYQFWAWVMFLLNKPNRESKEKKYIKNNKKLLEKLDEKKSPENVLNNNKTFVKKFEDKDI